MAGFPKKERQAIIDSFLNATGRNQFVPTEFLEWLRDNPDNPAHEIFYGMDDAEAAHAYRIGLVNRVYEQTDLLPKTLEYADMLSRRAPLAHRFAKNTMRRIATMPLQEALRAEVRSFYELGRTSDLEEGTTSFRERREANFKGR